jgi:hypothetical protein
VTRALARTAGVLAIVLACAALLAAWLSPDIVAAWATLASFCG